MWRRVKTEEDAGEYAELMHAASVDACKQLPAEQVISQMRRPGFRYWLYDDGKGGRIGFCYRHVSGCGYRCKVLQYEQAGLGYESATKLFGKKLREELDAEGVQEFETLGLIKVQPDKVAAIRKVFTEIVGEADEGERIRLQLDRSRGA